MFHNQQDTTKLFSLKTTVCQKLYHANVFSLTTDLHLVSNTLQSLTFSNIHRVQNGKLIMAHCRLHCQAAVTGENYLAHRYNSIYRERI